MCMYAVHTCAFCFTSLTSLPSVTMSLSMCVHILSILASLSARDLSMTLRTAVTVGLSVYRLMKSSQLVPLIYLTVLHAYMYMQVVELTCLLTTSLQNYFNLNSHTMFPTNNINTFDKGNFNFLHTKATIAHHNTSTSLVNNNLNQSTSLSTFFGTLINTSHEKSARIHKTLYLAGHAVSTYIS